MLVNMTNNNKVDMYYIKKASLLSSSLYDVAGR